MLESQGDVCCDTMEPSKGQAMRCPRGEALTGLHFNCLAPELDLDFETKMLNYIHSFHFKTH